MKEGDTVIIDKGFRNSGEVKIVVLRKHFSLVESDGYQWETMTSRLTPKPQDETLLQGESREGEV